MYKDKNITIYDIAREAGVSPATVSRVLTGKVKVSPDKALRIQSVMEDLDYHPNMMARNLQTQQSKTLGMVLPDISNPFFSRYFLEVEQYALTKGYTMLLCNTMNNAYRDLGDVESLYLNALIERRVDGIIFMGGRVNDRSPSAAHVEEMRMVAGRIPLVLANGRMPGLEVHTVRTNERAGFLAILEHLIALGHTEIAIAGGIAGIVPSDLKHRAFKELMKRHGLPVRDVWMVAEGFSIEAGEQIVGRLLACQKRPTAIACVNDFVAIGVLRGALKAGLAIPGDLSVSGFDDIAMAGHFFPSVSTVGHNYPLFAQRTVDALLALAEGKACAKDTIVPMELVARESTGPR